MTELKCHLNCTAAGKHVPGAERSLHLIKECIHGIVTTWPYKLVPVAFKISLVNFVVFWLNWTSRTSPIIPNVYSKALLTGQFPNYTKHCSLKFTTSSSLNGGSDLILRKNQCWLIIHHQISKMQKHTGLKMINLRNIWSKSNARLMTNRGK